MASSRHKPKPGRAGTRPQAGPGVRGRSVSQGLSGGSVPSSPQHSALGPRAAGLGDHHERQLLEVLLDETKERGTPAPAAASTPAHTSPRQPQLPEGETGANQERVSGVQRERSLRRARTETGPHLGLGDWAAARLFPRNTKGQLDFGRHGPPRRADGGGQSERENQGLVVSDFSPDRSAASSSSSRRARWAAPRRTVAAFIRRRIDSSSSAWVARPAATRLR